MKIPDFFGKLFGNSGEKIKVLAKVIFILGVVASLVLAIINFVNCSDAWRSQKEAYATAGIIYLLAGTAVSWISSLFTYAFGEIVSSQIKAGKYLDGKIGSSVNDEDEIESYICPSCGNTVLRGEDKCGECGQDFEW